MAAITRREAIALAGAGAASAAAGAHGAPSAPARCGMVILRSDEHNPFVTSLAGHPMVRTPNLERLARAGIMFENAYCASPLCMPSRSAFISGRRVHEIQAYSNCNVLPADFPTYGRVMREAGVHTVLAGKTDVYAPWDRLGFSEVLLPGDRTPPGDTMIARHPLAVRSGVGALRADGWGVPAQGGDPHRSDTACVSAAIDWLERSRPLDRPWTLEINIGAPHFPHYVTPEEWEMYPDGGDLPAYGNTCASARHPIARDLRRHFETDRFTEAQVRGLRRGYLGCITYVDRQLGRVLDALERLGIAGSTVLAYTSDHGEMLGKFGMWWKCSLYEDSVRVPLIAAGPGFARGRRVRTCVTTHDLQAAMFRATRAHRPPVWHGVPLQDLRGDDPDRVAFSEYHGHGTRCSSYMVRRGPWKLIYHADAPHQLFHLAADPQELHDLAAARPQVLRALAAELRRICDPERENRRAEARIHLQLAAIARRAQGSGSSKAP